MTSSLFRLSLFITAVGAISVGSAFAVQLPEVTQPGLNKLFGANVQCKPMPDYPETQSLPPDMTRVKMCDNQCKATVKQWQDRMDGVLKEAVSSDAAVQGAGSAGTQAAAQATKGPQDGTFQGSNTGYNVGQSAQTSRAGIATKVESVANQCVSQIESSCAQVGSTDKMQADDAKAGCQEIANGAKKFGAERAAEGGAMEGLGKAAEMAGQMLGPLMQAMQGGQGATPDPFQPTISQDTTQKSPAGVSLAGSDTVGGTTGFSLDNPNGAKFQTASTNAAGFTAPAASRSFSADPSLAAALGGSDYDSFGSGSPSIAGSGASSGSGAGGTNSSGASMMTDAEKAAAAANGEMGNYEIAMGGGGGSSKPFLGLKSKATDLSEFTGLDTNNGGALGDLGLGDDIDFGRGLASSEDSGIGGPEGETLFRKVSTKYAEMKKRGSI